MAPITSAVSARTQRVVVGQRADAGHELGPVQQGQAFLGAAARAVRGPARASAVGARDRARTVHRRLALADDDQRQVGQRRQVARGAQAAAGRHDRVHGRVEHRDQQLDDLDADAGEPDGQGVGAEHEHGPHDLVGQRIADAGRVATDQVALELGGLIGRDPDVGQVAEAGRDAVDGLRPSATSRSITAREAAIRSAAAGSSDDRSPAPRHLDRRRRW